MGKFQIQNIPSQIQNTTRQIPSTSSKGGQPGRRIGSEGGAGVNFLARYWSNPLTYCHLPALLLVQLSWLAGWLKRRGRQSYTLLRPKALASNISCDCQTSMQLFATSSPYYGLCIAPPLIFVLRWLKVLSWGCLVNTDSLTHWLIGSEIALMWLQ